MLVPPPLREHAGLEREVIIAGVHRALGRDLVGPGGPRPVTVGGPKELTLLRMRGWGVPRTKPVSGAGTDGGLEPFRKAGCAGGTPDPLRAATAPGHLRRPRR
jgi:hypothetical protein